MSINPANEIDVGKIKLVWRGTYNSSTAYTVDDVVFHDDGNTSSTYINISNSTGQAPSTGGTVNTSYWNTFVRGASGTSGGTGNGQIQTKLNTGFGGTSFFTFNTTTTRLGIGSEAPTSTLNVLGATSIKDDFIATGISTLSGQTNIDETLKVHEIIQNVSIVNGAANATSNLDVKTASNYLFTTNSGGTWTHNIRGDASTTLNSMMEVGEKISVMVISKQNNNSYYSTNITIDGAAQTEYWQYGLTPATGGASGYTTYTWSIIKTGNNAFTVVAGQALQT